MASNGRYCWSGGGMNGLNPTPEVSYVSFMASRSWNACWSPSL